MDSFIAPNILVEEVLQEDGKVVGIRTGDEKFYADSVILAEGVNNLAHSTGWPSGQICTGRSYAYGYQRNYSL